MNCLVSWKVNSYRQIFNQIIPPHDLLKFSKSVSAWSKYMVHSRGPIFISQLKCKLLHNWTETHLTKKKKVLLEIPAQRMNWSFPAFPFSDYDARLESASCMNKAFFAKHWQYNKHFIIITDNDGGGGVGRKEQNFLCCGNNVLFTKLNFPAAQPPSRPGAACTRNSGPAFIKHLRGTSRNHLAI